MAILDRENKGGLMSVGTQTLDTLSDILGIQEEEIAENIDAYSKLKRVEYSYQDGDDVYISDCTMTVTRKAWLTAMHRQIYQPSSTKVYGIKTPAERAQQVSHRNKTPRGKKVQ